RASTRLSASWSSPWPCAPWCDCHARGPGGARGWHCGESSAPSAAPLQLAEMRERVSDDDFDQLRIVDAAMPGLLGHEAQRRHARLGIGLQQEQPFLTALVVPAKVRPA